MNLNESVLKNEERIAFLLRSLYQQYGFLQYKMSKFEEYDLYAGCRDYLSDNIITFTDTNGKLMALKPDVTLSIVRNTKAVPGYVNKIFYNENVYRVSHGSHAYKEIMQAGLECIGDIDDYNIFETVLLAVKSLATISGDFVLSLSHLGIISSLLSELGLDEAEQKTAISLIGRKNMHELRKLCESAAAGTGTAGAAETGTVGATETGTAGAVGTGASETDAESAAKAGDEAGIGATTATKATATETDGSAEGGRSIDDVLSLFMLNDKPSVVIDRLQQLNCNPKYIAELKDLCSMLNAAGEGSKIVIDFSVVSDMKYYNGIVFKGYIKGVPESVLSGGQYDALISQMGKQGRAVGFAVYMDFLERYCESLRVYDVDAVIRYDDSTDRRTLFNAVQVAMNKGLKVTAQKEISDKLRYRMLYAIDEYGALKEEPSDSGKEAR